MRKTSQTFRLIIVVVSIVLLCVSTLLYLPPLDQVWLLLVLVPIVAFLVNFPLNIFQGEITLLHIVAWGGGLLYGATITSWSVVLGVFIGMVLRRTWEQRFNSYKTDQRQWWLDVGYLLGFNLIPLLIGLWVFWWPEGVCRGTPSNQPVWLEAVAPALLFILLHSVIFVGDLFLRTGRNLQTLSRDFISLLVIEFLPLPLILLAVEAYPATKESIFIALGGIPAVIEILMFRIGIDRRILERRLQELSVLNDISTTMQSTLDLEGLLPVIHDRVTQLLHLDNFYVALFDAEPQELWYPLAVKFGERQDWERRRMEDRLTDRVIISGAPILYSPETRSDIAPLGLLPSKDTPESWLGVPLIVSENTIGCLAVFSIDQGVKFTPADVRVLTTLSGQISVAIQNAFLYEQVQQRAKHLEMMNQLTTVMTASLDLFHVLSQVCKSVAIVGSGQRSAVFLLDVNGETVKLSHAHGLGEKFVQLFDEISIREGDFARCLRTGKPVVVSDTRRITLDAHISQVFRQNGIWAFADFPLISHNERIGFLSVYYDAAHEFFKDELELLQTLASQAALAVSNARLYESTDLALSRRLQQLSILEEVGRELSEAIHTDRLFQLILDYALEFTHSLCGAVDIYDSLTGYFDTKASRGYKQTISRYSAGDGITGRVVRSMKGENVGDVTKDPDFMDINEGETRSQLSVPIIHEARILGVITLESPHRDAFSNNDQAFISQLANQAAVALINAELYIETQRRLREQSTLYLVSTRLARTLELQQVVEILTQAVEASLQPSAVGVYLSNGRPGEYVLFIYPESGQKEGHLPSRVFTDTFSPEQFKDLQNGYILIKNNRTNVSPIIGECDRCQAFIFPLLLAEKILGFVIFHIDVDHYVHDEEIILLEAIIAQCTIAMQNARLYSDTAYGRDILSALIDSVGEGIIMIDVEGRVILVNELVQILTGLSNDELVNASLIDLPPSVLKILGYKKEEIPELLSNLEREDVVATPKIILQIPNLSPDRVLERLAFPVWGQNQRVIGWTILFRDVTEEYEMNQARELITETIVHDLRSPMSAVIGALDIISDTSQDDDDSILRQSLRVGQRSANRVLKLIESLLDISRFQSGQMELVFSLEDISTLIENLLSDFTVQANDLGVILRSDLSDQLPKVRVDREKIIRVLINLLDNALKFTPEGGQVFVKTSILPGGSIECRVQDSGPGVPQEYQTKIFERFYQVPGRSGRWRGSGLGLTFCRLAIEAHGGRIWVESPSESEGGSIFIFTLPADELNS
jgi:signal transduction histidine kinase/transcriptional regulator with GAF, ATPase, and Fis domain